MRKEQISGFHIRPAVVMVAAAFAVAAVPVWAAAPAITAVTIQKNDGTGTSKVAVKFSEAVLGSGGSGALSGDDFAFTGTAASGLTISSIDYIANATTAILTLGSSVPDVQTTGKLLVDMKTTLTDASSVPAVPGTLIDLNSATFDAVAPTLNPAFTVNNSVQPNTITLTFDEALADKGVAETISNWVVTNNDVTITYSLASASLSDDRKTVTITLVTPAPASSSTTFITSAAAADIKVTPAAAITDLVGNAIANTAVTNTGGTVTADSTAPTLSALLVKNSATTFKLSFSEKVNFVTAGTAANYTLRGTGGLTGHPTGAIPQANGTDVVLTVPTTAGFTGSQTLIVDVANVTDISGVALSGTASAFYTAPSAPAQPTVVAAAGNGQATLTFTTPANNGAALSGYTVVFTPSGGSPTTKILPGVIAGTVSVDDESGNEVRVTSVDGTTTVLTVSGLDNGTSYTFTVAATNTAGTGTASSSQSATPITLPSFTNRPALVTANPSRVGIGASVPLYSFKLSTAGSETIGSVKVIIGNPNGLAGGVDIPSISLYKVAANGTKTTVSTGNMVYVDGSSASLIMVGAAIDTSATYYVAANLSSTPTDGAHFTVTIPANAVTLSANSPTNSLTTGSAVITVDAVRPTLSDVAASSITGSGAAITLTSSEDGYGYYVALPIDVDGIPSISNVIAGQQSGGTPAAIHGSSPVLATPHFPLVVSGLSASTDYNVYYVVTDAAGNVPTDMSSAGSIRVTTTSGQADPTPADSGGYTPPPIDPNQAPPEVSFPTDVPSDFLASLGGTGITPIGNINNIFDISDPSMHVVGGLLNIDTNALSDPSKVMTFSGTTPDGMAMIFKDSGSDHTDSPMNFNIGGMNLSITPDSTGIAALMTTGTFDFFGDGNAEKFMMLSSGGATLGASAPNQVVGAINMGAGQPPLAIVSDSSSSSVSVSTSVSGSSLSPTASSVSISVDFPNLDAVSSVTRPPVDLSQADRFAASSSKIKLKIYAGEKLTLDTKGVVTSLILASKSGKGGAGDAVAIAPTTTVAVNTVVPYLNAKSDRLSAKLQDVVAQALGGTLVSDQSANGTLQLKTNAGTLTLLPIGQITVNPNRTDGVVMGANGLLAITKSGLTIKLVQSVSSFDAFQAALAKYFPNSTLSINADGAYTVKTGDKQIVVRPDGSKTLGVNAGNTAGIANVNGAVTYADGNGSSWIINPSFSDASAIQSIVASAVAGSTTEVNQDGSIKVSLSNKDGSKTTATLVPDYVVNPANTVESVSHTLNKDKWWMSGDGAINFLLNGTIQRATLKP